MHCEILFFEEEHENIQTNLRMRNFSYVSDHLWLEVWGGFLYLKQIDLWKHTWANIATKYQLIFWNRSWTLWNENIRKGNSTPLYIQVLRTTVYHTKEFVSIFLSHYPVLRSNVLRFWTLNRKWNFLCDKRESHHLTCRLKKKSDLRCS